MVVIVVFMKQIKSEVVLFLSITKTDVLSS